MEKMWKKFKLNYDLDRLSDELDHLFPRENFLIHNHNPVRQGTTFHNVNTGLMPQHIRAAIEDSIGYEIEDYYFLWDWGTTCLDLAPHIDKRDTATLGRVPNATVIVSLEGNFKLNICKDIDGEVVDSVEYEAGDIIVLKNTECYHSGTVIDTTIPKRTLNGYVQVGKLS